MKRNLVRRLERLEERVIPTGESTTMNIRFINPDGTDAPGGFSIEIPSYGPALYPRQAGTPRKPSSAN